ncbi:MAG: hypothetical protein E7621_00980 [Ruminococcaceae bacterium]|nr:hypothetical protein [Oscillospiraceae bacterium]
MKRVLFIITALFIAVGICACDKDPSYSDDNINSENPPEIETGDEGGNEDEDAFAQEEIPPAPEVVLTSADENFVMKVGDKEITEAMFRYYLLNYAKQYGGDNEKLWEEQAVKSIKKYVASDVLADKVGVVMGEEQNEYHKYLIAYTVNKYDNTPDTSYAKALEDMYLTDALNRDMTKSGIRANMLYNEYITEGGKMYNATDSDIFSYIKDNYVRIKHILIKTVDLDDSQKAEARKRAEKVCDQAMSGYDFEELVKQYSEDTMDVDIGYYFTRGEKIQVLENKAYELKNGEVSDIVESAYGYHIIKKYEHDREYVLSDKTLTSAALSSICEKAYATDVEIVAQSLKVQYYQNYQQVKKNILAEI